MDDSHLLRRCSERTTAASGTATAATCPTRPTSTHDHTIRSGRLDSSGYQASILVQPQELNLAPGEAAVVNATVRNIGTATWIAGQYDYTGDIRFRLGKHIWAESGVILPDDDDRTPLPSGIGPSGEVELELRITAPAAPGRYIVSLDLVHEHVTWFADHGSQTSSLVLDVVAANPADLDDDSGAHESAPNVAVSEPIQMHCLSVVDVETIVRSAGGRIETSWLSADSGDDWESRVYLVTHLPWAAEPRRQVASEPLRGCFYELVADLSSDHHNGHRDG